ncbi:MAG: WYL domain-containing transcriptional regulator [Phycisphaerae bacterium]|nr:WYL domain-containing transcriptional regulator [Phycisphaerae bacterium]
MKSGRVFRLLKIITLMQSGRLYDADGMAAELSVSRRTLFRDLKLLEMVGVPYRFDHNEGAYKIPEGQFMPPVRLTLEESLALLLVTRVFIARQVHPAYQYAVDAALKIESTLPAAVLEHCGAWLSGLSIQWPASSWADAVSGLFEKLQRALADRRRIRMRYDSTHDDREVVFLCDPLRLVFMTRGWYLIAHSHLHGEIRTFKVDRIVEVSMTEDRFKPDADFSLKKYFGKAWRMIPEGRLYSVRLKFTREVAASVEEVLWHSTQSTRKHPDGSLIFEAEVDGLREISAWVLSYGDQVEVLSPQPLRDIVRDRAKNMLAAARRLDAEVADLPGRVET